MRARYKLAVELAATWLLVGLGLCLMLTVIDHARTQDWAISFYDCAGRIVVAMALAIVCERTFAWLFPIPKGYWNTR